MKNQNRLLGIRWALTLIFGFVFILRCTFAQTLNQNAYTTFNFDNAVNEINAANNTVLRNIQGITGGPTGIDVTRTSWPVPDAAVVADANCAPPNPCVSWIQLNVNPPQVVSINNGYQAKFVTIAFANNGTNYAFVTTGGANVSVINADFGSLVGNITIKEPGAASYGIAQARNGSEVWVSDPVLPNLYRIDVNTLTYLEKFSFACPGGPPACPTYSPRLRHIGVATLSSTRYRLYVTDGTGDNKAVWRLDNTINADGSVTRTQLQPLRWPDAFINLFTYGVAVDYSANPPTRAYVTCPLATYNTTLFIIPLNLDANIEFDNVQNSMLSTRDYGSAVFNLATGVTFLADGRAYVANQGANQLTVISQNTASTGQIPVLGRSYWVASSAAAFLGPSGSIRIIRGVQ